MDKNDIFIQILDFYTETPDEEDARSILMYQEDLDAIIELPGVARKLLEVAQKRAEVEFDKARENLNATRRTFARFLPLKEEAKLEAAQPRKKAQRKKK